MVLRMLRVALPGGGPAERGRPARRPGARAAAGGRRLPGLPARGAGAAERASRSRASCCTSAPTRTRVARVGRRAARGARRPPTRTPRSSAPVLRAQPARSPTSSSSAARGRTAPSCSAICGAVQRELALVDRDIAERYFARRGAPRSRSRWRPPDALRDPLPDRVPLRRAGHRQPQRAARASRRRPRRSAATSSACASTPRRACHRHLDYFGTEVIEFGIPTGHERLTIDVRARVGDGRAAGAADGRLGGARRRRLPRGRRASSCCRGRTEPPIARRSTSSYALARDGEQRRTPRSRCCAS